MNALDILYHFYPADTPLRRLLLKHSEQVRNKALEILTASGLQLDAQMVSNGAMLHDIGIGRCHAPSILCVGTENYIAHGIIGAAMLRSYDAALEPYARICERHTGSGLSKQEILEQKLPLPPQDFFPETLPEKLICLADKFFSKSGDMREKTLSEVRHSLVKFGPDSIARLEEMIRLFSLE
ncbi:MAG: HDIG domain-containing protein [Victivallales bacterium]|nr:HDIG domain-containing protein [Victivallales bacterium]